MITIHLLNFARCTYKALKNRAEKLRSRKPEIIMIHATEEYLIKNGWRTKKEREDGYLEYERN